MDFEEMEDAAVPDVSVDQVINKMSDGENFETEEGPSEQGPTAENTTEQINNSGDGVPFTKLEPFATTSKSKHLGVPSIPRNKAGIQEFVRILRPHLPRKSKSKAFNILQNIAKGIIVESTFQQRIRQKKPKRRPQRKVKPQIRKTKKSLTSVCKNARSMYGSSDSCLSNASCPRCGYSCCRIPRY